MRRLSVGRNFTANVNDGTRNPETPSLRVIYDIFDNWKVRGKTYLDDVTEKYEGLVQLGSRYEQRRAYSPRNRRVLESSHAKNAGDAPASARTILKGFYAGVFAK